MTDHELIKMAADRSGIDVESRYEYDGWYYTETPYRVRFNPLREYSQAYSLMIDRNFTVAVKSYEVEVFGDSGCLVSIPLDKNSDKIEVVSRAIVIAAGVE